MLLFMSALLNLMPLALIIVCAGNPSNYASTDSCSSCSAKAANLLQKKILVSDKQVMWLSAMSLGSLCTEAETYIDEYELAVLSWRETNNSAFDPHLIVHLPRNMTLMTLPEFSHRRIKRFEQLGVRVVFHTLSFIDDLKKQPSPAKTRGGFGGRLCGRIFSSPWTPQNHCRKTFVAATSQSRLCTLDRLWYHVVAESIHGWIHGEHT